VPDAYHQADTVLGEILENISPDSAVMIVSDHGFRSRAAEDAGRYFAPLTERIRDRIIADVGQVDVARLGHKITVSLQEADHSAQKLALEAWLAGLTLASTGEPFYRWEDLPDSERALGLTLRDEMLEDDQLSTDRVGGEPITDYVKRTEGYAGEHHRDGIILVRAPGVEAGAVVDPVALLDVAPTALTLLGLPAADDMPGEVVFGSALPRVSTHASALPLFSPGATEAEINEDQLRALGYIE
jgi:arylsulfatase A-like enzyme